MKCYVDNCNENIDVYYKTNSQYVFKAGCCAQCLMRIRGDKFGSIDRIHTECSLAYNIVYTSISTPRSIEVYNYY